MFDEYDGFPLFPALKYFPIFYVLLSITYILLLLPHNDLDCYAMSKVCAVPNL